MDSCFNRETVLTINNQSYTREKLLEIGREMLYADQTPDWEKDIYRFILEWLEPKDHIIVKTSGSTGVPKEIRLQKKHMEHSAIQTCGFFNLNEGHDLLLCLPAVYIGGKMMIVRAVVLGCNLFITKPTADPFNRLNNPVDFAAVTPYQLAQSLKTLKKKPLVNTLIVGGGGLHPELEKATQDLPVDIFSTYGMTETSSHIALRRVNGKEKEQYFTVIGNTHIEIDHRGCLVLEDRELFEGKLITNDLVAIRGEKSFEWKGRFDNIINTGSIKVIPEEIEQKIREFVEGDFVITSVDNQQLGQEIVLLCEAGQQDLRELEAFRASLASSLPAYQNPRRVFEVSEIPLTTNGKIDRKAARELAEKMAAKTNSGFTH